MQAFVIELLKLQLIALPGAILLGLGLFAYFADASKIHPILEQPNVMHGCIIAGIFLLIIEVGLTLKTIRVHETRAQNNNS